MLSQVKVKKKMIAMEGKIKMYHVKRITKDNGVDLRLPNEPFTAQGVMEVDFTKGKWSTKFVASTESTTETFPEENYQLEDIDGAGFALGLYDEAEKCVALGIFQNRWNKYLYLSDLKVVAAHRGEGLGGQLLQAAKVFSQEQGYRGMSTIAQDNNPRACQFYLHAGFQLGGFNNRDYFWTSQKGKGDLYFYWEY